MSNAVVRSRRNLGTRSRRSSSKERRSERHLSSSAMPSSSTSLIARPSVAQHRLPFEILAKIFLELIPTHWDQTPPHTFSLRQRGKMPCWLKVGHICRSWRSVAFNCRSLWSYIPLESPAWSALALERSNPLPIRIDAGIDATSLNLVNPGALSIALAHAPRAQQISIATRERRSMMDSLEILRGLEVPRLERLELFFFPFAGDPMPIIPLDAFRGTVPPELRVLIIIDVFLPPKTSIFSPSLTHLEMAIFTPAWDNLSQTLDTLASLPNLEYLALMRGTVLPPWHKGDPYAVTGPRTIRLPRLKTLRLNGDACVVLRSLQTIEAPVCEVSCLVFALERDAGGILEDPSAIAAGLTHPRWSDLPTIPAAISSAYTSDIAPSITMTHLVITSAMDPVWHTVNDLTAFLRNLPHLQTLTMRCSPWHELPARPTEDVAPVRMEHLERLHLWSRFPCVLSTLSDYIVIPDTAERHVTVDGGPPEDTPIDEFVATLRAVYQLPATPSDDELTYRKLSVAELKDDFFFGVCITVSDPTPAAPGQTPLPPSLELNIPLFTLGKPYPAIPPPNTVTRLAALTSAIVRAFPLHGCTDLTVAHLLFEDQDMWYRVFSHLDSVTRLSVRPGPNLARTAARELCVSRQPGAIPLFPNLSELHLEQVDFADPAFTPCPFQIWQDRPEKYRPQYLLQVSRSYVDDEILDVLRHDFACGVRWDGVCDHSARKLPRSWRQSRYPPPVPVVPVVPATVNSGASVPVVPIAVNVAPGAAAAAAD